MNKKKKIFLITGISLLVLIAIVGGTYAWYVWTTSDSDTTKIVAGVGAATVTFDGGSDISANLRPVSDKSKGIVKNISVGHDGFRQFPVIGSYSSRISQCSQILARIKIGRASCRERV